MVKFFFIATFCLGLFTRVSAQKISEEYLQKAEQLGSRYEEDDVVLLKNQSEYTYGINPETHAVMVTENEDFQYLALNSLGRFTKKIFYNNHIKILDYSIKTEKNRNLDHEKFCGHYESDGIFYSDAQICGYIFDMRQKGRFANFKSTLVYDDPRYLTKVYFHDDFPSENREIIIKVPHSIDVEILEFNFDNYSIKKEVKGEGADSEMTTYIYSIKEIEAFPKDHNIPGYAHFMPHIIILTKSYRVDNETKTILSCTDDLYNWYASLVENANSGGESEELRSKVIEITSGSTNREEKIKAIYYWVQDNIKYIAFENGLAAFRPEAASKVFYNRYGDCKGMANLTKTMLRIAGFDARLTWLGTNILPYTYDMPSLAVDNHMICCVMVDDVKYLLDPTEKFNSFNLNAERIQGKQVLIEDGDHYIMDEVPFEPLDRYMENDKITYQLSADGLVAKGTSVFDGEYKKILLNVHDIIESKDEDKFIKTLVSGENKIDNVMVKSHSDFERDIPLEINYDISLPNQLNVFGDEMYLDIDFQKDFKGLEMEKERRTPYFFDRKVNKKLQAELSIPKGYKLSHLPENMEVENDYFKFDLKYELRQNKLFYRKEIKVFKNILPTSEFDSWNSAIDQLNNFYNEQIILQSGED